MTPTEDTRATRLFPGIVPCREFRPKRFWQGRHGRELLHLAWPLILQSLAYTLLGIIDRLMVGQLAETAVAAVGIGGQVLFCVVTLAGALAAATGILGAQLRGAEDREGMAALVGTSVAATAAGGTIGTLLLWFGAHRSALWLANGDPAIGELAARFIAITALSLPLVLVTFVVTGVMRAMGDTRTPLLSSFVAIALNTGLNVLLINGYGGFPRLGVTGAAIATAVAQAAGAGVAFACLRYGTFGGYAFAWAHLTHLSAGVGRKLVGLALPIGLDALFWQAASLAYTRIVGLLGAEALAAWFVFQGLRGLGYIPLGAIGAAAAIVAGQRLGARRPRRCQTAVNHAVVLAVGAAVLMGFLTLLVVGPYLRFYAVAPEVANEAGWLIRAFLLVLPFEAVIVVLAGVLRAGGDALVVSLMTLSTFWLIGIPTAWYCGVHLGWGLPGCFVGLTLESVVKAYLFARRRRSGRWARHLIDHRDAPPVTSASA